MFSTRNAMPSRLGIETSVSALRISARLVPASANRLSIVSLHQRSPGAACPTAAKTTTPNRNDQIDKQMLLHLMNILVFPGLLEQNKENSSEHDRSLSTNYT